MDIHNHPGWFGKHLLPGVLAIAMTAGSAGVMTAQTQTGSASPGDDSDKAQPTELDKAEHLGDKVENAFESNPLLKDYHAGFDFHGYKLTFQPVDPDVSPFEPT